MTDQTIATNARPILTAKIMTGFWRSVNGLACQIDRGGGRCPRLRAGFVRFAVQEDTFANPGT